MTRDEAASILGIEKSASPDEVRSAFRALAKLAHPDTAGGEAEEATVPVGPVPLNQAVQAREILLTSPGTPMGAPAAPAPVPTAPPRPQPSRGPGIALSIAAAIFGLVVFGLVALVVISLAAGGAEQVPTADACVIIGAEDVTIAACTTAGAQHIDTRFEGPGECPPGTNTLIAGDVTYCLRPAGF